MKTVLLALFICSFSFPLFAQNGPSWLWAKASTGTSDDMANSIAIDKNGNTYVTGSFTSPTITFGNSTLTNSGNHDIFIVKYNPAGSVVWARKGGSMYDERAWGIASDSSGNTYITGHFSISITFGGVTLNSSASNSIYIVKYNSSGSVVWARQAGSTTSGSATPRGIAVDASGACYITGFCSDESITFGSTTLTGAGIGGYDPFVAKYDAAGNVVWAKRPIGTGSDFGQAIAVDKNGNCYVTGYFESNSLDFGTANLSFQFSASRIFTVKYNVSGDAVWARSSGFYGGQEKGMGIAADSMGNAYVTGILFAPVVSFDTITLYNQGQTDLFLVKYDVSGGVAWAKNPGGISDETGVGVGVDAYGNSYITGQFFGADATFGNTTLPSGGASNVFVVKFDDTGAVAWAKSVGGGASSFASGIAVDRDGNSHIAGLYSGINGGISFGSNTLQQTNLPSAFTAKLSNGVLPSRVGPLMSPVNDAGFTIFPNPAAKIVHLRFSKAGDGEILITDCLGRTAGTAQVIRGIYEFDLDISRIPSGLYIVSYRTGTSVERTNLLKN